MNTHFNFLFYIKWLTELILEFTILEDVIIEEDIEDIIEDIKIFNTSQTSLLHTYI